MLRCGGADAEYNFIADGGLEGWEDNFCDWHLGRCGRYVKSFDGDYCDKMRGECEKLNMLACVVL